MITAADMREVMARTAEGFGEPPPPPVDAIVRGVDVAAAAMSKAVLLTGGRSDPIYEHLHEAMNALAAVRVLASISPAD